MCLSIFDLAIKERGLEVGMSLQMDNIRVALAGWARAEAEQFCTAVALDGRAAGDFHDNRRWRPDTCNLSD